METSAISKPFNITNIIRGSIFTLPNNLSVVTGKLTIAEYSAVMGLQQSICLASNKTMTGTASPQTDCFHFGHLAKPL